MIFNCIASNRFELDHFKNIEKFVDSYSDFQAVTLKNENELILLLRLIGINEFKFHKLSNLEFSKYWDLSSFKFPEFTEEQFDEFYKNWIDKSQRENNMNEYGSLIFLQGKSQQWNKLNYRLIVRQLKINEQN